MSRTLLLLMAVLSISSVNARAGISFDAAVAEILSRSTIIETQKDNLGVVRALNLPVRLAFAPSISLDAKHTTTGGIGILGSYNNRQLEGVAQLNLWKWGADLKNWQAASADESSQQALIEDAYLRVQDGAVNVIIAYIQRKKEIDVAARFVKMRQESLTIAQQRYDGGYLPQQELRKVSVDLANATALLDDAQNASTLATSQLQNLLGHSEVELEWPWFARFAAISPALQDSEVRSSPRSSPNPNLSSGQSMSSPPALLGDTELAQLLSKRPDWRAAQAKVDAEAARLSRSWRLLGPSLDGQLSYGYYYGDVAGPAGQPGPFGGSQWQGSLTLTLPLFDRLSLYSNARAQSFTRNAAEAALEQVRRDARSEWESARRIFVTALGSAQNRDQTLKASRGLYQDHLLRFKSGRINADELVLEQTRLLDSESLAVRGWASAHLAYSLLCKAQGLKLEDCKIQ